MSPSLRLLLAGVVDYAGLFPPAALTMEPALETFARASAGDAGWMLGRFVCPAARLEELWANARQLPHGGPPLTIAATGRSGATADDFLAGMEADLRAIGAFHHSYAAQLRGQVGVLELKLPADILSDPSRQRHLVGVMAGLFSRFASSPALAFYEAPAVESLSALLELVAELNRRPKNASWKVPASGYKLRTGGTVATAFPEPPRFAHALHAALRAGVPMKCTAGLHHPLRAFHASVQTTMHGFVNVLMSAALLHAGVAGPGLLADVLAEEEAKAFTFTDAGADWRGYRVTADQIQAARRWFLSFGSCSIDEPRAGLQDLGWW